MLSDSMGETRAMSTWCVREMIGDPVGSNTVNPGKGGKETA